MRTQSIKLKLKIKIPSNLESIAVEGLKFFNSCEDAISVEAVYKNQTITLDLNDFSVLWFEWERILQNDKQTLEILSSCARESLRALTDKQVDNHSVAYNFIQKIINK